FVVGSVYACVISIFLGDVPPAVRSALVSDLDPTRFGLGYRNLFLFVNASTRRGASNRLHSRCDSVAFRRSSLSRAHCHGGSLVDLLDRGRPLGSNLWASSESESAVARNREHFAGNGSLDAQRGRCAAADPCLDHFALGEGIVPRQGCSLGGGIVTGDGCLCPICRRILLHPRPIPWFNRHERVESLRARRTICRLW